MIDSSSCLTSQDNIDFVSNFPNLYLSDVTIGVSSCQIFFISSIRNNFHFVLIYFSCFRPGKSSWNLPRVREECDQRPPNHEIISWNLDTIWISVTKMFLSKLLSVITCEFRFRWRHSGGTSSSSLWIIQRSLLCNWWKYFSSIKSGQVAMLD